MNQFDGHFLCGSFFKSLCKYSVQEYSDARSHRFLFKIHKKGDESKIFVKTEYLNHFLHNVQIEYEFDLLTHNSDINIFDQNYEDALSLQPNLRYWYAQNLNSRHSMMRVLPIGIANPKWEHGNQEILREIQEQSGLLIKNRPVYVNFDINTNSSIRQDCLNKINLPMEKKRPFKDHLKALSESLFCISPDGNGLDCHRHWECFYLKTIPIVTRSVFTELLQEKGLPLLILDKWEDFSRESLTRELYSQIWGDFDPSILKNLFIK